MKNETQKKNKSMAEFDNERADGRDGRTNRSVGADDDDMGRNGVTRVTNEGKHGDD